MSVWEPILTDIFDIISLLIRAGLQYKNVCGHTTESPIR